MSRWITPWRCSRPSARASCERAVDHLGHAEAAPRRRAVCSSVLAAMPVEHACRSALGVARARARARSRGAPPCACTRCASQASCASIARSSASPARASCSVFSATSSCVAAVARLVEPVHAGVGDQRGDGVAVEHVADLQPRRHRQRAARGAARPRAALRRARARAAPARWRCRGCRRRARPRTSASLAACASLPSRAQRARARAAASAPCTPSLVSTKQSPTRSSPCR